MFMKMDVEYDSDLSDIPEEEISVSGTVMPYMYEPVCRANNTESEDSDDYSSSSSFGHEFDDIVPEVSTWCRCKNCINMPTVAESKCCKTTNIVDGKVEAEGLACITDHDGFRANCLNKHVLEVAFYDHVLQTGPLEENQKLHELYRHLAYRRFVRWVYGLLGKGVRKVIPSCAVTAIRNMFPSEEYCGFKYPK